MREKDSPFSEGGERDKFWESERRIFRMYFVYPDEYLATGVLFFQVSCNTMPLERPNIHTRKLESRGRRREQVSCFRCTCSSSLLSCCVGCWHYLIPDTSLPVAVFRCCYVVCCGPKGRTTQPPYPTRERNQPARRQRRQHPFLFFPFLLFHPIPFLSSPLSIQSRGLSFSSTHRGCGGYPFFSLPSIILTLPPYHPFTCHSSSFLPYPFDRLVSFFRFLQMEVMLVPAISSCVCG